MRLRIPYRAPQSADEHPPLIATRNQAFDVLLIVATGIGATIVGLMFAG